MVRTIAILALLAIPLVAGCKSTGPQTDQAKLQRELGAKVPLWVELECSKRGKPKFKEYSVLKLPSESVGWALARLDDDCRVYGTLVEKGRKPDLCDIRYRSKEPVVVGKRCRCVANRYALEEGYPTSKRCCEKYPDKVYCKDKSAPTPAPEPETRTGD